MQTGKTLNENTTMPPSPLLANPLHSMPLRLGVNVDHVATLRNARGGLHPDPVRAAHVAISASADGITAQMIDGTMGPDERKRIILGFARREYTVLVSVALLTFGFDLAAAAGMDVTVESMSDLCPRKSLPMMLQVWGRVLRMKDHPAIIADHAGNWRENGFPDDDRDWSLDGSNKRATSDEKAASRPGRSSCFKRS